MTRAEFRGAMQKAQSDLTLLLVEAADQRRRCLEAGQRAARGEEPQPGDSDFRGHDVLEIDLWSVHPLVEALYALVRTR